MRLPRGLFVLVLCVASFCRTAWADGTVSGALPNGLRYTVVPHPSPKGDVSLRLMVNAGSLDEQDDERGFAHFVEHMAFNGSRQHPAGTLRQLFQGLGLSFGADLNASTGYTYTQYLLDLPDQRASDLDLALGVLRDYADGLLFPPDQVARESGVVISELNARDSAGRRASTQLVNVVFARTRLPSREVGGVAEILHGATAERLRAFYRRNYTPERMTVILVGPVDPAAAVEKIRATFESLVSAPGALPPAPVPAPADLSAAKADVLVSPTAKGVGIRLLALSPRAPDTPEGRRQELAGRLATAAFYTRLRARRDREDFTQFSPPRVVYDPPPFGTLNQYVAEMSSTESSWDDALEMMASELHRASTAGFTDAEIAEAAAGQLTYARNQDAEFAGKPAARIAAEVASRVVNGRTWRLPADERAETETMLASIDAKEVSAQLSQIFPTNALRIVLAVPPDKTIKPERALSLYLKSMARDVKPANDAQPSLVFHYQSFGKAGTVVKQERVEDLDLTLVRFANDVQLNLRPSNFEPGRFRLRVVFPANFSDVPANSGGLAELAGQLLLASDLRHQPQSDLVRLFKMQGVEPQIAVTNGTPILSITGPSSALEFSLRFLTALLSDLKLDLDHYRVALSQYGGLHQSVRNSPAPYAVRAALRAFAGNDTRLNLTPPERFGNEAGFDEAQVWLSDHVLNAPLEIGLVGDFTTDDVVKLGADTVGTLNKRRAKKHGAPIALPKKSVRQAGSAELPASTSLCCVLWPVSLPDSPKSNAAVALAVDVLRDREMLVLRESLGATYSPDVRLVRDAVQRDLAFVAVVNTFEPAQSEKLSLVSMAVGVQLAKIGVSREEFERLKEPARTRRAQDLRNNAWWLNAVSVAQTQPERLNEVREHTSALDALTINDVSEAARIFSVDRLVSVLLHPASANIPAPGKTPKKAPANN
jgi:zinc protease